MKNLLVIVAISLALASPALAKCKTREFMNANDPARDLLIGERQVWIKGVSPARTYLRTYIDGQVFVVLYGPDKCFIKGETVPSSAVPEIIAEWGRPQK